MLVLFGLLWPLERLNSALLGVGRVIAVTALAIMVCLILGQVFFRYALNSAPNWTEEGARFGMLWMTGLMAPIAYRMGGFVAIDMVERALPKMIAGLLTLALLAALGNFDEIPMHIRATARTGASKIRPMVASKAPTKTVGIMGFVNGTKVEAGWTLGSERDGRELLVMLLPRKCIWKASSQCGR